MANKHPFEICVRAIIIKNGKLLACKNKAKDYYFFPGGHIEFGETAKEALTRELKEELGLKIEKLEYMGTVENIYTEDKIKHHEINLVFKVNAGKLKSKSREGHIDFDFVDFKNLKHKKIYPLALKNILAKWLKDKKTFWASQAKR